MRNPPPNRRKGLVFVDRMVIFENEGFEAPIDPNLIPPAVAVPVPPLDDENFPRLPGNIDRMTEHMAPEPRETEHNRLLRWIAMLVQTFVPDGMWKQKVPTDEDIDTFLS